MSRRSVLGVASGAFVGVGAAGLASATPADRATVNVGFDSERGRRAALDAASEVVREFAFDAMTVRLPAAAADALANRPDVRYVEADGRMHALAQTSPSSGECIGADVARACDETGDGVDVAIIDTGIEAAHPDLQPNLGAGYAFVSCNSSYGLCHYSWGDDNGHGTHAAGVVGAADDTQGVVGVAPDATLHAVKVLDHAGTGTYSDIAAGIEFTADQGWDVASLGFGGSASSAVRDAVQYADAHGVTLVAAAGNSGPCTNCVGYPAAYPEVLAVASVGNCDCTLSSFSSTGPSLDLLAPGENVLSTFVGRSYETFSGTSMAAPHVAGAVAVVSSAGFADPVQRLCNTADCTGACSCCGRVNLDAAVGCSLTAD